MENGFPRQPRAIPGVGMTNQSYREWIYRMAFETGRHIIGYEVQKVLAAIDSGCTRWLCFRPRTNHRRPISRRMTRIRTTSPKPPLG